MNLEIFRGATMNLIIGAILGLRRRKRLWRKLKLVAITSF